jgi:D-alanyl-D-alanine carboxypeptidase
LLGGLIEKVTGQPFAVQLEERITGPLGLANTYLDDGSGPAPGHGYFSLDQGATFLDVADFPNQAAMTEASTAGAIDSTLSDLLVWATALYRGDLLGADTTSSMVDSVDDGWHESADTVIGLGAIGFCPCRDDPPWEPDFIGHDGGFIGSTTLLVFQPTTGVAMVLHANRDADLELINGFLDVAHSAAKMVVTDAEAP